MRHRSLTLAAKEAAARLDGELAALRSRPWWRRQGGLKEAKDCRRIILAGSLVATAVALTNHWAVSCVSDLSAMTLLALLFPDPGGAECAAAEGTNLHIAFKNMQPTFLYAAIAAGCPVYHLALACAHDLTPPPSLRARARVWSYRR